MTPWPGQWHSYFWSLHFPGSDEPFSIFALLPYSFFNTWSLIMNGCTILKIFSIAKKATNLTYCFQFCTQASGPVLHCCGNIATVNIAMHCIVGSHIAINQPKLSDAPPSSPHTIVSDICCMIYWSHTPLCCAARHWLRYNVEKSKTLLNAVWCSATLLNVVWCSRS